MDDSSFVFARNYFRNNNGAVAQSGRSNRLKPGVSVVQIHPVPLETISCNGNTAPDMGLVRFDSADCRVTKGPTGR